MSTPPVAVPWPIPVSAGIGLRAVHHEALLRRDNHVELRELPRLVRLGALTRFHLRQSNLSSRSLAS